MRLALAVVLVGCGNIDPNVGSFHVDRPSPGPQVDAPSGQPPRVDAASDATTDASPDGDARAPQAGVSFRRDVRPLMNRSGSDPTGKGCKNCHYSTEVNHQGIDLGGLDLATLGALREGGGSTGRRIIVPGKPEESGFVQKLRGTYPYGTRMPKNGPAYWSDADVKVVTDWIAEGAQGSDDE
jgi:hypothetical protein